MARINRRTTSRSSRTPTKSPRFLAVLSFSLVALACYRQLPQANNIIPTLFSPTSEKDSSAIQVTVQRQVTEGQAKLQQLLSTKKGQQSTTTSSSKTYYDESQIVKFTDTLVTAPQTVVTAYFQVKSKHSSNNYAKWMKNMLSLEDPMVIFLSPALIPEIKELRQHALDRTVIIPMEVDQVPLAKNYNASFWQWQLDIDREKRIHRSYFVFWIWLSKSWWVTEAIRHNFFNSQVFVWSDMGCFRDRNYNHKTMVARIETIPRNRMLFLAHHPLNVPPARIWNNKYTQKHHFYHSGSIFAGYADTFIQFEQYFMDTLQEFLDRDMFIGEDQLVMQSTCLMHPDICAYIDHVHVNDNHYFGLRYVLHRGGNYTYWYPPSLA
ncbi:Bacterial protein of unknown function (HtrL_YibB) [Seminavis robusta]|uniref:Uncharacterized protein n=1 Tax=Seminavis robusta TaxID=568900 RepID=A0A9N8DJ25_9STRA|nr:Bacterial protein of unknown function (HtrL_YibB) [Seminavis robusta]|eukprot:Sro87_g046180.1 Bacterial protein of unknown function (HtrL_YibB) (379) ;mRNA; f:96716-97852